LFSIANKWNWSREELGRLSTFGSWNHEIQEAFRKDVIDFLVDSYQRIRDRTKDIPVRISASDLATVGRKIQRFFKQIPGKIPYEILLFEGKCASGIAIEETQGAERGWSASVSLGSEKKPLLRIVRAMPHPLFACGWCSVNGFYDGTQKIVFRGSGRVSERNLREAMAAIREFFPSGEADDSRLDVLVKDPVVSHLLLMPNWENPDGASALTSISVFYRTSMGEVFFGSNVGESCQSWLIKEILLGVVGKPNWPRLAWKVHVSVGTMKSTRRVSDALGRMVGHCLSGESEKPPTIFFRGNF
jgi:adenylate cyclase